jgi:hypothetical protein
MIRDDLFGLGNGGLHRSKPKKRNLTHAQKIWCWENKSHKCNICEKSVSKISEAGKPQKKSSGKRSLRKCLRLHRLIAQGLPKLLHHALSELVRISMNHVSIPAFYTFQNCRLVYNTVFIHVNKMVYPMFDSGYVAFLWKPVFVEDTKA